MKNRFDLKRWEKVLLLVAALLFLVSSGLYATGTTLRHLFLSGWEGSSEARVGTLLSTSTGVRRQYSGQSNFEFIEESTILYNGDTLVTGSEGEALMVLDEGTQIVLAPNTMVKLAFESSFSLAGVSRTTEIRVIAGRVKGEGATNQVVISGSAGRVRLESGKLAESAGSGKVPAHISAPFASRPKVDSLAKAKKNSDRAAEGLILPPGLPAGTSGGTAATAAAGATAATGATGAIAGLGAGAAALPLGVAAAVALNSGTPSTGPGTPGNPGSPATSPGTKGGPTTNPAKPVTKPAVGGASSSKPSSSSKSSSSSSSKSPLIASVSGMVPVDGLVVNVSSNSKVAEAPVKFQWKVTSNQFVPKVNVVVRPSGANPNKVAVSTQTVNMSKVAGTTNGTGVLRKVFDSPGDYEWEVMLPPGQTLTTTAKGKLKINPEFFAIQGLDWLVSGKKLTTNQVIDVPLDNFEYQLKWTPFSGAAQYNVAVGTAGKLKTDHVVPIDSVKVATSNAVLLKNKIPTIGFYYEVWSDLPRGFVVRSPIKKYGFRFLPPALVNPTNGSQESITIRTGNIVNTNGNNGLLLTWAKTHFTQSYDLEVSKDRKFGKLLKKVTVPSDNFYTFPIEKGTYYWRVRAKARSGPLDLWSGFSPYFQVKVTD